MPDDQRPPTFSDSWRQAPKRVSPEPRWLTSLTTVPGVVVDDGLYWPEKEHRDYQTPPDVFRSGGQSYLVWTGGQSAVKQWGHERDRSALPLPEFAADLRKGLCRPGEPFDYHFALQDFAGFAFDRRDADPDALAWTEWSCWLNLRLIEAVPGAARIGGMKDDDFVRVLAYDTLATIYENEGMLELARDVMERARGFRNSLNTEALDERIAHLRAEDEA